jgi:hypothetical protein
MRVTIGVKLLETVVTGAIGWSHTTGKRRTHIAARLGIESLDKEPA